MSIKLNWFDQFENEQIKLLVSDTRSGENPMGEKSIYKNFRENKIYE